MKSVERRIVEETKRRLRDGREKYGTWPLPKDPNRNMIREAIEEALDLNNYLLKRLLEIEHEERKLEGCAGDMENAGKAAVKVPVGASKNGRKVHSVSPGNAKRKGNVGGGKKRRGGS